MADAILVEQEIETGKTERAKALFEEIGEMRNTDEALQLLAKEGVFTETAFLHESEEGAHVIYYIEAEDGEEVHDVYQDIMADPDGEAEGMEEIIREFQAVIAGEPSLVDGELLYHLVNPAR